MHVKVRDFTGGPLVAGTTYELEAAYAGALAAKAEIIAQVPELTFSIKATAGTPALTAADVDAILDGIVLRVRADVNGEQNAVNIKPLPLRRVAAWATRRDGVTEEVKAGLALSTTNQTVHLPILIPGGFVGALEHKNVHAYSGRQLNKGGKVYLEVKDPAGWAALALPSGATVVISNVKATLWVQRMHKERDTDFAAPTIFIKERSWQDNPEAEKGPFYDLFAAILSPPATADTDLVSLNITENGEAVVRNAKPSDIARAFKRNCAPDDGLAPLDITAGTNGITPFHAPQGAVAADETEWPVTGAKGRTIEANGGASINAQSILLMRVQSRDADTFQTHFRAMAEDLGLSGLDMNRCAVKGGGAPNNGMHAEYKPVWFAYPKKGGK